MANTLLINRTALGTPSGGEYPDWNSQTDPNINNLDYGELAWNNGKQKLYIARVSDNTGGKTLQQIGGTTAFKVTDGSGSTDMAHDSTLTIQGTNNEISVSESSGTFTVGLPTSISLSNNVTVGNDLSVAGDITVTGDLTVNGSTTTINSTTVTIDDKSFVVADGQTAANCDAAGYFISDVASIIYEHTGTKLQARVGASLGPFEASTITATTFVGGNVTEWDSAYSDRMKWDGGSSGLTAATGRTSLGLGTAATLNTAAVSDGAATLSTGDQIHTFVTTVTIDGGTF